MIGDFVHLRALEPEDIDALYRLENDPETWRVGDTLTPISKYTLAQYIENAHLDIYTVKQYRFVIVENTTEQIVGTMDLFDFDPFHLRAAIGILIDKEYRKRGYADDSLALIDDYCHSVLHLHQIYAEINQENNPSISLFEKHNFNRIGIKNQWRKKAQGWSDVLMYQKIFEIE